MNKIKNVTRGSTLGLLAIGLSTAVSAQEQASGGTIMTLGVSQRLSYSDNADFMAMPNEAFTSTTGLSFALTSATKVEMISLNTSGGIVYDTETGDFSVSDPSLSLGYKRENKDSGIVATMGYRESDISEFVDVTAGSTSFLVLDEGTRSDLGGTLTYDFGRTDPFSGNVTLTYNRTDYTGTASVDLVDQETAGVSGRLNFRIDDRIATFVSASYSSRSTDDGIDTTNLGVGAGVALAYSKRLDLEASVQLNRVDQTITGITAMSEGIGYAFNADYEMPDGAITASLSTSVDENGRTYTARADRSMALKTGTLSYGVGLSGRETGSLNPLYTVSYSQELPRDAQASLQLSQSFATNDSDREAVNSSLTAKYDMPLTAVSAIGAMLQYRETNVLNFDDEDVSRLDVGVNYTHALADDWGVVTGYTYSLATEDGVADRESNSVFVGLQKDFSWRP